MNNFNASRNFHWISSLDKSNAELLLNLEEKMQQYYNKSVYYDDIVPATMLWKQLEQEPLHFDLLEKVRGKKVLEIGCGKAEILSTGQIDFGDYSGCDFSSELMSSNQKRFPKADFQPLKAGGYLPYADQTFDAVFSIFVLEHAVFPTRFLTESVRVLRPGGVWVLLCPDFLGCNRMSSQRVGYSLGSGRDKIKKGRILDAAFTFIDNKVRMPRKCAELRDDYRRGGGFYVNLAPVCFVEKEFQPDVDAIYLTYKKEIVDYLEPELSFDQQKDLVRLTEKQRRLIYLSGVKSN